MEEDAHYYLEYREYVPRQKPATWERIDKRMDQLFSWFSAIELSPAAIDICRSTHSGYQPAEQSAYVEECFFRRLGEMYPIEIIAE